MYSDTWTPINNSQDTYYTVSGWIYVENVANDVQIWLSTESQEKQLIVVTIVQKQRKVLGVSIKNGVGSCRC